MNIFHCHDILLYCFFIVLFSICCWWSGSSLFTLLLFSESLNKCLVWYQQCDEVKSVSDSKSLLSDVCVCDYSCSVHFLWTLHVHGLHRMMSSSDKPNPWASLVLWTASTSAWSECVREKGGQLEGWILISVAKHSSSSASFPCWHVLDMNAVNVCVL